jgi:hypothetical protein
MLYTYSATIREILCINFHIILTGFLVLKHVPFPKPSDTIGNHVESYLHFKSLKDSIGVDIFLWDG